VSGLALKDVSKRFGTTLVLDRISLDIAAGEFVVVLGPSGCGKSTLLRAVAGLESIDAGTIELDGKRIDQLAPGKRGVAMVFQSYALYPHMNVRENMAFGLHNSGVGRAEAERRIVEAARMLEMQHLLDRKPAELSGGQRQRAAIGRAIVKAPKLFMFDEPLSNLDAALRSRTRQEIAALHRRIKTAMIFVTHDQTEAMTLADRIVVMNERRIEQIGTPREIYDRPSTEFVATFVGSPPMNILAATCAPPHGAMLCAKLGDGTELETSVPAALAPKDGRVRVGLRPEGLRLCSAGSGDCDAKIDFVEFLGDRTYAFVSLAGGERIVVLGGGPATPRPGEAVGIQIDRASARVFDSEGRNLRVEG
jgi:multiple sugar transport system ATP-binding protein